MADLDEIQRVPEFPLHYRIRLACEMAGVEPEELAELLDVHENTAHNYVAGRTRPRRPALKIVAERTRVSLQWLETGETSVSEKDIEGSQWQLDLFGEDDQVSAPVGWHPSLAAA